MAHTHPVAMAHTHSVAAHQVATPVHTSRHSYFAAYPQPPCTHTHTHNPHAHIHTQSQLTPRDCSDLVGAGWGDEGAASLSSLSHVDVNAVCLSFNPRFARTRACAHSLPRALLSRALSLQPSLYSAPSRSFVSVCVARAYTHACMHIIPRPTPHHR